MGHGQKGLLDISVDTEEEKKLVGGDLWGKDSRQREGLEQQPWWELHNRPKDQKERHGGWTRVRRGWLVRDPFRHGRGWAVVHTARGVNSRHRAVSSEALNR